MVLIFAPFTLYALSDDVGAFDYCQVSCSSKKFSKYNSRARSRGYSANAPSGRPSAGDRCASSSWGWRYLDRDVELLTDVRVAHLLVPVRRDPVRVFPRQRSRRHRKPVLIVISVEAGDPRADPCQLVDLLDRPVDHGGIRIGLPVPAVKDDLEGVLGRGNRRRRGAHSLSRCLRFLEAETS